MQRFEADVLVVGGGVSGLLAAWRAVEAGVRALVAVPGPGASADLQGVGVSLGHADPRDSPSVHFGDIQREGRGLSGRALAHQTAELAGPAFHLLVKLGVPFATRPDVKFVQRRSGARATRAAAT